MDIDYDSKVSGTGNGIGSPIRDLFIDKVTFGSPFFPRVPFFRRSHFLKICFLYISTHSTNIYKYIVTSLFIPQCGF